MGLGDCSAYPKTGGAGCPVKRTHQTLARMMQNVRTTPLTTSPIEVIPFWQQWRVIICALHWGADCAAVMCKVPPPRAKGLTNKDPQHYDPPSHRAKRCVGPAAFWVTKHTVAEEAPALLLSLRLAALHAGAAWHPQLLSSPGAGPSRCA